VNIASQLVQISMLPSFGNALRVSEIAELLYSNTPVTHALPDVQLNESKNTALGLQQQSFLEVLCFKRPSADSAEIVRDRSRDFT
jgi:hypothetical protein